MLYKTGALLNLMATPNSSYVICPAEIVVFGWKLMNNEPSFEFKNTFSVDSFFLPVGELR